MKYKKNIKQVIDLLVMKKLNKFKNNILLKCYWTDFKLCTQYKI